MNLLGVSLSLTTIRGRAADTCKRCGGPGGESGLVTHKLTIAALFVCFTIAALIVLSAITMGAVAGA